MTAEEYLRKNHLTREDFLSEPGEVPMIRVVTQTGKIVAVVSPEEFEEMYDVQ